MIDSNGSIVVWHHTTPLYIVKHTNATCRYHSVGKGKAVEVLMYLLMYLFLPAISLLVTVENIPGYRDLPRTIPPYSAYTHPPNHSLAKIFIPISSFLLAATRELVHEKPNTIPTYSRLAKIFIPRGGYSSR